MRVAALFAGIGGLELGLHEAGHETVMTCEIWDPAVTVLANRFPGIPNRRDVTALKSLPANAQLLTAGFPCQDLSQDGMTAGIRGRRSGLVGYVFRLLDKRRIPIVVLENVSFMLQLDRGAAMHRLTREFEKRGYRWAYRTVNSLAFVPQRRERVFFVATIGDVDPAAVLFADDVTPPALHTKLTTHAHGFYWTEGTRA
jgi:DNA (cytosine-5)-methyltransferase 1